MRVCPHPIPPAAAVLLTFVVASVPPTRAHNNPSFREELLHTLDVSDRPLAAGDGAAPAANTAPFVLSPPRRSVELVWRVDAPAAKDAISFALAQGGKVVAEGLRDGAVSKLLRGDGFAIVDVTGAEGPFTVRIYANVIDRSRPQAATPGG